MNEPNDLRKQVTWPGRRGIRQALARRRDYASLKRGTYYFSDRLVRARVKFRHGILVPPYSSVSQYSSRRNRMSHHRDLPLPEAGFSAPVKCENRLVALVCLVCLVCLVEQDQLDELNKPDRPDEPDEPDEPDKPTEFFRRLLGRKGICLESRGLAISTSVSFHFI